MQFDPTLLLTQIQSVAASFGPWGLLVAAGIAVYLRLRKPATAPTAPASPATPTPADPTPLPSVPTPASPTGTGRQLIDLAMRILGGLAARKYPHLTQEEGVQRMLVEHAGTAYYMDDKSREPKKE